MVGTWASVGRPLECSCRNRSRGQDFGCNEARWTRSAQGQRHASSKGAVVLHALRVRLALVQIVRWCVRSAGFLYRLKSRETVSTLRYDCC